MNQYVLARAVCAKSTATVLSALFLFALGCGYLDASIPKLGQESGSGVVHKMIKERQENPFVAKDTYVGTRQTVGGRVESIDLYPSVPSRLWLTMDFGSDVVLKVVFAQRLPLNTSSRPWPGYEWLDKVKVGDRIEIECLVSGFSSWWDTPNLEECEYLA